MGRARMSAVVATVLVLGSASGAAADSGWQRLEGPNRYATSVAIASQLQAEEGAGSYRVILASGEHFPDALVASALARAQGGVLLLVRADSIPEDVAEKLTELSPHNLTIVGGEAAVSAAVEAEARALTNAASVTRRGGRDRYETATLVGNEPNVGYIYDGHPPFDAVVVTGENFPDALVGSTMAELVLLTRPNELPESVRDYLEDWIGLTWNLNITVIGGKEVVSSEVEQELDSMFPNGLVRRIAGQDRYETAALASASWGHGVPAPWMRNQGEPDRAVIASGENFPDAMVASTLTLQHVAGPLLLTRKSCMPQATAAEIARLQAPRKFVVGGADVAATAPNC